MGGKKEDRLHELKTKKEKRKKTQPRPILGMQQDTSCFFCASPHFSTDDHFFPWILERVLPPLVLVVVKSIFLRPPPRNVESYREEPWTLAVEDKNVAPFYFPDPAASSILELWFRGHP